MKKFLIVLIILLAFTVIIAGCGKAAPTTPAPTTKTCWGWDARRWWAWLRDQACLRSACTWSGSTWA